MASSSNVKRKARERVNSEIRAKRLPDPNDLPCIDCGHIWKQGERRHEYDHPRGYEGDAALDVEPRCTRCHHRKDSARANQTHCVNGHPFDELNTGRKPNGTRFCRECRRVFDRTRRTRPSGFWAKTNLKRKDRRYGKRD